MQDYEWTPDAEVIDQERDRYSGPCALRGRLWRVIPRGAGTLRLEARSGNGENFYGGMPIRVLEARK